MSVCGLKMSDSKQCTNFIIQQGVSLPRRKAFPEENHRVIWALLLGYDVLHHTVVCNIHNDRIMNACGGGTEVCTQEPSQTLSDVQKKNESITYSDV